MKMKCYNPSSLPCGLLTTPCGSLQALRPLQLRVLWGLKHDASQTTSTNVSSLNITKNCVGIILHNFYVV